MNTYSILSVLALACVASAFTEQEYQTAFTKWTHDFNRVYASDEFQTKYAIFKQHMDFVQAWNADQTHTHTVALNQFADITNAEYRRIYLGTKVDGTARLANAAPFTVKAPADSSVDWNAKGAVTPIKNQGQCGSCWSFSTTGSTEGAHEISTGNLVSLSEQNLVDCSGSYGNNGCNGGSMDAAFQYIIDNQGIDTEASYPYSDPPAQGQCQFDSSNVGATISSYTNVNSGDEDALTTAINQQPISVAIDASHESFQLYSSGVYNEPSCSTSQLDHGVLAIGYGSDSDSGSNYFLVKNSWGTSWGQEGYIWMTRDGSNQCGIATDASYPTV